MNPTAVTEEILSEYKKSLKKLQELEQEALKTAYEFQAETVKIESYLFEEDFRVLREYVELTERFKAEANTELNREMQVKFDPSLQQRDSYVFVHTSKIHTVADLLQDIRTRFNVSEELSLLLNDCSVLHTEDILVLADAEELKIIPERSNLTTLNVPSTSKLAKIVSPKASQSVPSNVYQTHATYPKGTGNRNNYGSIAETIKFLSEVSGTKQSVESRVQNGDIEEAGTRAAEQAHQVDVANGDGEKETGTDEASEQYSHKRKRKRKRKHSKNKGQVHCYDSHPKTNPELDKTDLSTSLNSQSAPRSHIYFTDNLEGNHGKVKNIDEPDMMEYETEPLPCSASSNIHKQTFPDNEYDQSQHFRSTSCAKNLEPRRDKYLGRAIAPARISDLSESGSISSEDSFKQALYKPMSERSENSFKALSRYKPVLEESNAEYTITPVPIETVARSFFDTIRRNSGSNGRNSIESKSSDKNGSDLSTLLMCKQLKTHLECNVQFPTSRGGNKQKVVSKVAEHVLNTDTQQDKEGSGDRIEEEKEDEVEYVEPPYVVKGSVIKVRVPGSKDFAAITADLAMQTFPLVTVPQEKQTIIFQILLLGQNMCPTMTNFILGKVVLFKEEAGKVAIEVSSDFMEPLVKEFGTEDGALPDDIVWITENTYEFNWFSLTNPRLLVS